MAKKPRVLVLCIENRARSQMTEAFLRKYAGDEFEVHTALASSRRPSIPMFTGDG